MDFDLSRVGDDELVSSVRALAKRSCELDADLLLQMAELDERKLFRERGFSSMFAFCTGDLRFSEDVAYNRIEVARLARRIPSVLDLIRKGELHITGLRILAPHLTPANAGELLPQAQRRSKRDIEELVARLAPRPPVPERIRKLPTRSSAPSSAPAVALEPPTAAVLVSDPSRVALSHARCPTVARPPEPQPLVGGPMEGSDQIAGSGQLAATVALQPVPQPFRLEPVKPRSRVQPLSADSFKLEVTIDRELRDMMLEAKDLFRHAIPDGDLAEILKRALRMLVAKKKKTRFSLADRPRTTDTLKANPLSSGKALDAPVQPAPQPPNEVDSATRSRTGSLFDARVSRNIPAAIQREVYVRDGGRCSYVGKDGHRCEARAFLEFDHLDGFARTKEHRADRIALRCRIHNELSAEQLYGKDFMTSARTSSRAGATRGGLALDLAKGPPIAPQPGRP